MTERSIRRAVVTGPTGVVGSALVRCLIGHGVEVYAVVRPDSPRRATLPEGATPVLCDLRDIARLPELIPGGADAFFHLGWQGAVGKDRQNPALQAQNLPASVAAAQAAAALGCSVFVGAGSQAEHGRVEGLIRVDTPCKPLTCYGAAKLCAGQLTREAARQAGMAHVWLRILSVYGPNDAPTYAIPMMIRTLREGGTPALTPGEQLWDYIYSADAAEALWLAALRGQDGAVYPLGSGQARPLREYFEILRDACAPGAHLGFGEVPYSPGQVMHLQADLTPLTRDTGFLPRYTFEQGIRETLEAYGKAVSP